MANSAALRKQPFTISQNVLIGAATEVVVIERRQVERPPAAFSCTDRLARGAGGLTCAAAERDESPFANRDRKPRRPNTP